MKHPTLTAAAAAAVLGSVLVGNGFAQSGPELLLKPMTPGIRADGFAWATYFFETDTQLGEDEDAQLERYTINARYRLAPEQKADPRVGVSATYLNTGSPGDLPKSFTDVSLSFGTGIAEFDGWVAGLTLGAGWAGANEFGEDGDAYYGMATLLVGRELREHVSLGIALDYNGNRSFMPDVPLPGVVLTWELPEQKLEISAGFPFAYGRWRPIEPLLLEVNFQFPDFVGARVTYDFSPGWGVFGSLARRTDAWKAEDFGGEHDRIIFEQTVAEVGLRVDSKDDRFSLLIAGGYAFRQEFSVGFDTRDTDKITDLQDGPFIRIEGQFAF